MAKTLSVHVLYGDKADLLTVISRLAENDFSFNYSGEYLYSSTPWDLFLETYCQDIKDRLHPCVESWSESCLSGLYEGKESDTEVTIFEEGNNQPLCKVYTYPCYIDQFRSFLKEKGIQYEWLPKKF